MKVLHAKTSFFVLQVLDLLTTLAAFHLGAFEVNPLVARLTTVFGPIGGILFSKVAACLIVLRVRRLVWVVNVFYSGIVCWNFFLLLIIAANRH